MTWNTHPSFLFLLPRLQPLQLPVARHRTSTMDGGATRTGSFSGMEPTELEFTVDPNTAIMIKEYKKRRLVHRTRSAQIQASVVSAMSAMSVMSVVSAMSVMSVMNAMSVMSVMSCVLHTLRVSVCAT